jgi:hypothetical protein
MGPLGNGSKCNTWCRVQENREVRRGDCGGRGITWCRTVSHCVASAVRAPGSCRVSGRDCPCPPRRLRSAVRGLRCRLSITDGDSRCSAVCCGRRGGRKRRVGRRGEVRRSEGGRGWLRGAGPRGGRGRPGLCGPVNHTDVIPIAPCQLVPASRNRCDLRVCTSVAEPLKFIPAPQRCMRM